MRRLIVLAGLFVVGFGTAALAQEQDFSRSCVHGLHNIKNVEELGVNGVRIVFTDAEIQAAFEDPTSKFAKGLTFIHDMHETGHDVIVALRFPKAEGKKIGSRVEQERVPQGEDRAKSLALVTRFLLKVGPDITAVQLGNEPAGGRGYYGDEDIVSSKAEQSSSILWLQDLSAHIKSMKRQHPDLEHIKMIGPGLTSIGEYLRGKTYPKVRLQYINDLIKFSDENMDYIDVHMHVRSVDQLKAVLDFVKTKTKMPIVALEWSQAKALKEWIEDPVTFEPERKSKTNRTFMESAYKNKVSAEEWAKFVSSAPLTADFIERSYDYMQARGFDYICYAPANQYGTPYYDVTSLYVPLTVKELEEGVKPRNGFIYDQFKKTISKNR